MTKQEFLSALRKQLAGLPRQEAEERLTFYSEMIDDRMEEGLSEEEAVAAVGGVDEACKQLQVEAPLAKNEAKQPKAKRRFSAVEITLLAIGSLMWIAAVAVALALYISTWAVIVSFWSVFASLAACAVCSVPACVMFFIDGSGATGLAMLAAGFVCAGLAILAFYGCREATKGVVWLTKQTVIGIKSWFVKKEKAQ